MRLSLLATVQVCQVWSEWKLHILLGGNTFMLLCVEVN